MSLTYYHILCPVYGGIMSVCRCPAKSREAVSWSGNQPVPFPGKVLLSVVDGGMVSMQKISLLNKCSGWWRHGIWAPWEGTIYRIPSGGVYSNEFPSTRGGCLFLAVYRAFGSGSGCCQLACSIANFNSNPGLLSKYSLEIKLKHWNPVKNYIKTL